MKKSILFTICLFAFNAYLASAQQRFLKLDSILRVPMVPLQLTGDTLDLPLENLEPAFVNYNGVYKQRLDSLQQSVPLAYNEFVQKYIDIYTSRKDMMGKMLGLSSYYFPIFEQALKTLDIPEELKYIPVIESSMNPLAVSRVGATGMWQFMFSTARGYGLNINNFVDERKDPVQASLAAAAYFRDAYAELGDWLLAIAAYNCGKGNVNRAIAKANSRDFWAIRPFLPLETRNYVPAFIAAVYVMKCAKSHQIELQQTVLNDVSETLQVRRFVSLHQLAEALNVEEAVLCSLNPCYKKKIVNGSEEVPKIIVVPKTNFSDFERVYQLLNESNVEVNALIIPSSDDDKRIKRRFTAKARVKTNSAKGSSKKYLSYKSNASSQSNSDKM
jgi:membrane-bound lytic murein transglycosylase D